MAKLREVKLVEELRAKLRSIWLQVPLICSFVHRSVCLLPNHLSCMYYLPIIGWVLFWKWSRGRGIPTKDLFSVSSGLHLSFLCTVWVVVCYYHRYIVTLSINQNFVKRELLWMLLFFCYKGWVILSHLVSCVRICLLLENQCKIPFHFLLS